MIGVIKNLVVRGGRPQVSRTQILGATPVRNALVEWERVSPDEDRQNVALLRIPRRRDRFGNVVAKIFRLPDFRRLELDEIGSDVWESCDGTMTVDTITREISRKYQLNRRQAEASVTAYLKMLADRHLLGLRTARSPKASEKGKNGSAVRRRKQA